MRILAQSISIDGQQINGPLDPRIQKLGDLVSRLTQFLVPVAGIILFFVLVWGGYDFLLSQGNPEKVKSAQAKITTGIIGFILLVFSYLIVKIIAIIFGTGQGIL